MKFSFFAGFEFESLQAQVFVRLAVGQRGNDKAMLLRWRFGKSGLSDQFHRQLFALRTLPFALPAAAGFFQLQRW